MDIIPFVFATTFFVALASYLTSRHTSRYTEERFNRAEEQRSIWAEMDRLGVRIDTVEERLAHQIGLRIDAVEEQFIREIGQVHQAMNQKVEKSSRT